jgi:hypothetical protein
MNFDAVANVTVNYVVRLQTTMFYTGGTHGFGFSSGFSEHGNGIYQCFGDAKKAKERVDAANPNCGSDVVHMITPRIFVGSDVRVDRRPLTSKERRLYIYEILKWLKTVLRDRPWHDNGVAAVRKWREKCQKEAPY